MEGFRGAPVPIRLVGGRISLDFLNSADWREDGGVAVDKLSTPAELSRWATVAGLGPLAPADDPALAALLVFRRQVREALLAAIHHTPRRLDAMASIDKALRTDAPLLEADRIASRADGVSTATLAKVVAASAAGILADPRELERLKICTGPNCGWLFVDESRNGVRRWCSMATCGNRAKARRHHSRTAKRSNACK